MAATASKNAITLKGSTEIVAEFFGKENTSVKSAIKSIRPPGVSMLDYYNH